MVTNRIEEVLLMTKQLRNKEKKIIKSVGMLSWLLFLSPQLEKVFFTFWKFTNFHRLCTYISVFFFFQLAGQQKVWYLGTIVKFLFLQQKTRMKSTRLRCKLLGGTQTTFLNWKKWSVHWDLWTQNRTHAPRSRQRVSNNWMPQYLNTDQ